VIAKCLVLNREAKMKNVFRIYLIAAYGVLFAVFGVNPVSALL